MKINHTEITKQLQEVKNAMLSFQKELQQKQFVAPASGSGKSNLNAVGPSTQVRNPNGSSRTSGENATTSPAALVEGYCWSQANESADQHLSLLWNRESLASRLSGEIEEII